jgi:hypothetical protein
MMKLLLEAAEPRVDAAFHARYAIDGITERRAGGRHYNGRVMFAGRERWRRHPPGRAHAVLAGALLLVISPVQADETARAFTGYVGRITTVNAWHDIVLEPDQLEFADAYLATLALSREVARYRENQLGFETEGQVVYNFGDQSHWEFNALLAARWHRFPWNETAATTMAFGAGLSWATEVPEVEVELEDASEQLLIYWMWEMTFSPPGARWGGTFRLHHRSKGFGLLAEDGGMNALCLGVRYEF